MSDVYLSYVKHGFVHSFSADYDTMLCRWRIHMLVLHCKIRNKLYLGEYYVFYRFLRRYLYKLNNLEHKAELIEALEERYNSVLKAYLEQFVFTVRKKCPSPNQLYEYGQSTIEGIHQIIEHYHLDLTITRIFQPKSVIYYFMRKDKILASYMLSKTNHDHLNFEYA